MFSESKAGAGGAWSCTFAALLGEQWELLRGLDGLSRRQRELIAGDSPDELLALMEERQEIVDRLEAITAKLEPMQTRWREGHAEVVALLRQEIEGRLRDLASLAREIAARDAQDQRLLAERKRGIAEELASMAGSQRAMHAYAGGPRGAGGAVFQDREA